MIGLINLSLTKLVPIMQKTGVAEKSQQRVVAFFKDLGGAPVIIAVTIWKWDDAPGAGNFQSGSALMQNMLLAAHAEGLGTCWMTAGSLVEKEVLEYLGKPDQTTAGHHPHRLLRQRTPGGAPQTPGGALAGVLEVRGADLERCAPSTGGHLGPPLQDI